MLAGSLPIGALDPGFNAVGWATATVGSNDSDGAGALQPDGRIVVAGSVTGSGRVPTIVVIRYLPDGQLDTGFGPARTGIVALDPLRQIDQASAVAVVTSPGSPDDGKILVAGSWTDPAMRHGLALVRLDPDGSLDPGFGTDGVVSDSREPNATGLALAIQPDGKVVAEGESNVGTSTQPSYVPFVERFDTDGRPDPSFGTGGQPVTPFGSFPVVTTGGMELDGRGNIVLAGVEQVNSTPTIAVARLNPDGQFDPSFGSGGISTIGIDTAEVPVNVQGVAIDPSRGILVAGTAIPNPNGGTLGSTTLADFWVARYDSLGHGDLSFNGGKVEYVDFQQSGRSDFDACSAVAVQPDGKVVLAGLTYPGAFGTGEAETALVRLNADGTPDVGFGSGGRVITALDPSGNAIDSVPRSVLVQPDGNIVVTGAASNIPTGPAFSAFAVARYVGTGAPGSGTIPAGIYREDFSSATDPTRPGFDGTGVFQHAFWYNLQPDGPQSPSDVEGAGWDIEPAPTPGPFALHLTGATDIITFPGLRPDVGVSLASLDVDAPTGTDVIFVGDNGTYTAHVGPGDNQTVAAGESHVLQADQDGNPTLELGLIREIILPSLDASSKSFLDVKILVTPGQGPLDDFVTAAPGVQTSFDVLTYASGGAAAAGLQLPLTLVSVTQPSLTGGQAAISMADPGQIVYTNTLLAVPGQHPIDTFRYTVQDSAGKDATGTVYVTIDRPPSFDGVVQHFDATPAVDTLPHDAAWDVPHGTAGPLTGDITLSDAEGDPVTLVLLDPAMHGTVTLNKTSDYHYRYEYDPPTINAYDSGTGVTTRVSAIVGPDQFTLEASDGIAVTDYTIRFSVTDRAPIEAAIDANIGHRPPGDEFIVPENTGGSYYGISLVAPDNYNPDFDRPGLVYCAAPGVLWNQVDPDGDPLMAVPDPSHLPQHGVLQLFPDGSFTYTPFPNFTGDDTFGYWPSDGYLVGGDLRNPSAPSPVYVVIHVVAGVGPVLIDAHYEINLTNASDSSPVCDLCTSTDQTEFTQPITLRNDYVDGRPDPYPRTAALIRPVDVTPESGSESVVNIAERIYGQFLHLNYTNESQFFSTLYLYFKVFLEGRDIGYPLFGLGANPDVRGLLPGPAVQVFSPNNEVLARPLGETTDFSFTYAFANSSGWLSNFASVVIEVIPDYTPSLPSHVTLHDPSGQAVNVDAGPSSLSDVQIVTPPPVSAVDMMAGEAGFVVPWIVSFQVSGLQALSVGPVGSSGAVVRITLPSDYPHFTIYYKYDDNAGHWYRFMYDPAHGSFTGAEVESDPATGQQIIILHLIDGGGGDNDHTVNGVIVDPGGPAAFTDPARNFVASLYEDVLGRFPVDAEMTHWVEALDRGESRLKVARAVWGSGEHRALQVDQWSMRYLGHPAGPSEQARWVALLRRGRGEIAVQQAILTSPDYRRAHPTMAAFIAGLNHDLLGLYGDPVDPSRGRLRRHGGGISLGKLAREFLTKPTTAAALAQRDATIFLGRPATAQESRADGRALRRGPTAPERIAERILSSDAFYEFVNSALPTKTTPLQVGQHAHPARRRPAR